jgi:superfamily I DNA and/or RNA helicase
LIILGTGKSQKIIEEVLEDLNERPNEKILITSSSRQALHQLLSRLHATIEEMMENKQLDIALVPRSERYPQDPIPDKIAQYSTRKSSKLQRANIVFCTCASSHKLESKFDLIIFDEASKTSVSEGLIPFKKAKTNSRILFVGDRNQLGPYLSTEAEEKGYSSLVNYLLETFPDLHKQVLKDQHRMNQPIWNSVKEIFHLQGSSTVDITEPWHQEFASVTYIDPKSSYCTETSEKEAEICRDIVYRLHEKYNVDPNNIALLTFYNRQVTLLQKYFQSPHWKDLIIKTVDSFQGSERDIVIISCVRSRSGTGFLNRKRFYVALTRAKSTLIVVGDKQTFNDALSENQKRKAESERRKTESKRQRY